MAGLTFMSLSSARYIPFFSPVAALMIARYGSRMLSKLPRIEILKAAEKRVDILFPVVLAITLVIVINNTDLFKSGIKANNYPDGAVRFIEQNRIQGNMFNPYVWGGYLMWSLYPDYKVFIDGRGLIGDVFFEEVKVMDAYTGNIAGLPAWKAYLNAYNVNFIVTYSVGNFTGRLVPLVPALLHDPEWHLVYFDNISLIFVRENAQNSELLKRFDLPKEWLWNEVAVEAALKAQDYKGNANYRITEGDAFLAKQSYWDARTAYLQALQINPDNSLVKKRLEYLHAYGY
jgi:tetratricopeptide (TPR) repeat protein